jgi:hypothetical protein
MNINEGLPYGHYLDFENPGDYFEYNTDDDIEYDYGDDKSEELEWNYQLINFSKRKVKRIKRKECCICFEKITCQSMFCDFGCGNEFHSKCVETVSKCPLCRKCDFK